MKKYILDQKGDLVVEEDILKWAEWFETAERHLGKDQIGDSLVSTVFLGIDHSFGTGPPILWETMVFGGLNSDYQERYTSKEDALKGHQMVCEKVRNGELIGDSE